MKFLKILLPILFIGLFTNCASRYKNIAPEKTSLYTKSISDSGVLLEYKYQLPSRKYRRRARKHDIKIVSVKITNNSGKDMVFGNDFNLVYEKTNTPVEIVDRNVIYKSIKQRPAYYLFFLGLCPVQSYQTTTTNSSYYGQTTTTSDNGFPAGLILGPAFAASNMIIASTANGKFRKNLSNYDLTGMTIKAGATAYGIIGVRSKTEDLLKLN